MSEADPAVATLTQYELIDSKELARRWNVPETWVREHVRSRSPDPIPHVRLGRHVRFEWACPELQEWWARRRRIGVSNRGKGGESGRR